MKNTYNYKICEPGVANRITAIITLAVIILLPAVGSASAQGPSPDYYYNPGSTIPWAELTVSQPGGSFLKIPFLPVIDRKTNSPIGSFQYTKKIEVKGEIVFAGNGIYSEDDSYDSYFGRRNDWKDSVLNVENKIVLVCPDLRDSLKPDLNDSFDIIKLISEAAGRGASGLIIYRNDDKAPFLAVNTTDYPEAERLPVITIKREDAYRLLASCMSNYKEYTGSWGKGKYPGSMELIASAGFSIDSEFKRIETNDFRFLYRDDEIDDSAVKKLSDINQQSISFIMNTLKGIDDLKWEKLTVVYFGGFDSKIFFTRHWGFGMASDAGVFSVIQDQVSGFGLAVHENTHMLQYRNIGGSSSFISEGFARYTEALATDKEMNNKATYENLKGGRLYPLAEMLKFEIGKTGPETDVGYPASGSFIAFIAERYGQNKIVDLIKDPYLEGFGTPVNKTEEEWHKWLRSKYNK